MRTANIGRGRLLFAVPTALAGWRSRGCSPPPDGPSPTAAVRVLAVGLGATVFGLAAWQWLQRDERRPALDAELLCGHWQPSRAPGRSPSAYWWFSRPPRPRGGRTSRWRRAPSSTSSASSGPGRLGAVTVACTALVTLIAAVAYRRSLPWPAAPVLALTGLALIARPIGGHMSQQTLGSLLDAAHVLAAATWFGMLTALALTARSRGAWASLLPRYSTIAWRWCGPRRNGPDQRGRSGSAASLRWSPPATAAWSSRRSSRWPGCSPPCGGCAARGWARRPHTGSTPSVTASSRRRIGHDGSRIRAGRGSRDHRLIRTPTRPRW